MMDHDDVSNDLLEKFMETFYGAYVHKTVDGKTSAFATINVKLGGLPFYVFVPHEALGEISRKTKLMGANDVLELKWVLSKDTIVDVVRKWSRRPCP